MAFPTASECYTAMRARAADIDGDIFTDAVCLSGVQAAVRDLFRAMANSANPRIMKTVFYPVPANTSILSPATAGINDMGEPMELWERGGFTSKAVSAVAVSAPNITITTSTSHGRATGDAVTLNKLGGLTGAEGMFAATVVDADELRINGLLVTGTYTSGGTVGYSTEEFNPVAIKDEVLDLPDDVTTNIRAAVWQGDRWHLTQASETRELAIDYSSSATVPTSGSDVIGVDDCIDFIAARALGVVCLTRAPQIAEAQNFEAFGRDPDRKGRSGLLYSILNQATLTQQIGDQSERDRLPFRNRWQYTSSLAEVS